MRPACILVLALCAVASASLAQQPAGNDQAAAGTRCCTPGPSHGKSDARSRSHGGNVRRGVFYQASMAMRRSFAVRLVAVQIGGVTVQGNHFTVRRGNGVETEAKA